MADISSALRSTIPISLFNRGMAGKVFEDVRRQGAKVVMKNNSPECVLLSPEEYLRLIDEVNDAKLAALAAQRDILFSVHAPYYISMSSLEEDKRLNSIQYLLQSAAVCRALGGRRIIFHSGSCGKQSREAALEKALDTMRRAVAALDEAGFGDMTLCPETMGKIGQLGTLDEVLALGSVDERITPCIDFGHLNARTLGGIQSKADYAATLARMAEALGDERARRFHVHFSRIEYSKGGEKRHWTFAETQFGPEPQPLMELLAERRLEPVIICESAGTQAEDAQAMQRMYEAARG